MKRLALLILACAGVAAAQTLPCTATVSSGNWWMLPWTGTSPDGFYPTITTSVTVTLTPACAPGTTWYVAPRDPAFAPAWLTIVRQEGNLTPQGTFTFTALSNTTMMGREAPLVILINQPAGSPGWMSTPFVSTGVTEAPSPEPLLNRQVRTLYQGLLGRDPDANGWNFWTGRGQNSLGAMAASFLTSAEGTTTGMQQMAIYQAVRASAVYNTFANERLATGGGTTAEQFFNTKAALTAGFLANGYPSFVNSIYVNMLSRAPTATELNAAVAELTAATKTPFNIFQDLYYSDEYRNLGQHSFGPDHTAPSFIRLLYWEILGRDPDASGFEFWLNVAAHGSPGLIFQSAPLANVTLANILGPGTPGTGFIGSAEFQGRF